MRYLAVRRYAEVLAILLLLPFLVPLFCLIALVIAVDSPGPVLFRQQRTGRHGQLFTMMKFRTMYARDDARRAPVTAVGDPRITTVGRFLRSSHLDEIPQLVNVLRGEMSVVGPRPEVAEMADIYDHLLPEFWLRLQVPPGITGLAQMRRGYADNLESTRLKVMDDVEYIDHISPLLDLLIVMKTIPAVFRMDGR